MNVAVIGTGPTGWATTKKLLELGHKVTILDTSLEESDPYKSFIESKKPTEKKLFFGSDLPYRYFPYGSGSENLGVKTVSSFNQGGLSLVWGATMLPYSKLDLVNWPFMESELKAHFQSLTSWIPITGERDGLSEVYEDFISRHSFIPSEKILRILESTTNIQGTFVIGSARLAVETGTLDAMGCYYCNSCLAGCPGSFIWSTVNERLDTLRIKMRVTHLSEGEKLVHVKGITIEGHTLNDLTFDKVFIAAGSIESFRLLASSNLVSNQQELKDSAMFFLPIYIPPKFGRSNTNSFALSQIFIRLKGKSSTNSAFYQIYDFSDQIVEKARSSFFFGKLFPKILFKFILQKMVIGIGYLDGLDSPSIQMILRDDGTVSLSLSKTGKSLKSRNLEIRSVNRSLSNHLKRLKIYPLSSLCRYALPGEGVHYGAWLPMGEKSDLLGRPTGCLNIHVVDSTILPSISPGPITFTVMANALRIVSECFK
jgi:hypothetical protein